MKENTYYLILQDKLAELKAMHHTFRRKVDLAMEHMAFYERCVRENDKKMDIVVDEIEKIQRAARAERTLFQWMERGR